MSICRWLRREQVLRRSDFRQQNCGRNGRQKQRIPLAGEPTPWSSFMCNSHLFIPAKSWWDIVVLHDVVLRARAYMSRFCVVTGVGTEDCWFIPVSLLWWDHHTSGMDLDGCALCWRRVRKRMYERRQRVHVLSCQVWRKLLLTQRSKASYWWLCRRRQKCYLFYMYH